MPLKSINQSKAEIIEMKKQTTPTQFDKKKND